MGFTKLQEENVRRVAPPSLLTNGDKLQSSGNLFRKKAQRRNIKPVLKRVGV